MRIAWRDIMVFSSLIFLYLFLPLNLIFYFAIKNQAYRNWVLIISSLFFYAWGEPVWISILIFSTFFDYFNGLIVEKYRGKWQSRAALISSIVVNLSLLGFFKYSGFLMGNINYLLNTSIEFKEYALPIGISFYTFQTISYVVDVYRGEVEAQKSPFKLLLYVSLFHQLVAGPIVRYKDIAYEIDHRIILPSGFSYGINRFVTGLGKKVILANTAGEISDIFLKGDISQLSILGAWFGIVLFALQIYFDFSGYSDMAIGLGKMFGFNYKENFNYPYVSTSATEFWRRWHISLGSFFRDYVYIPLGGNKRYHIRNLIVVWFLTGLWHGASWNFVIWGVYYGGLIIIEKVFLLNILERIPRVISHLYLITVVLIGWVFFYYTDLSKATELLRVMSGIGKNSLVDSYFYVYFLNNAAFLAVALIACTPIVKLIKSMIPQFPAREKIGFVYNEALRPVINFGIIVLSLILLVGKTYNPFLYFRF
jgi:alginate O-acetyltransferase complex protein AlgI